MKHPFSRKRSGRLALVQNRLKGTNEGHRHRILDNIHWVNPVTERFRHLTSLLITNETVDKDVLEWLTTGEFQGLEDHTRHPEEDDVVTCYQG